MHCVLLGITVGPMYIQCSFPLQEWTRTGNTFVDSESHANGYDSSDDSYAGEII